MGRIKDIRGVVDFYKDDFLSAIGSEKIKEKKFRIIVDFSFGLGSEYFPSILNDLGCEVISLNGYTIQHSRDVNPDKSVNLLSRIVKSTDSMAAFWLDPWGQRLYLVDELGKIYKDLDSFLLLFHLLLKVEEPTTVAVPLFLPSYIDAFAEEYGFKIVRTKNSVRSVSEHVKDNGAGFLSYPDGRFIFTEFHGAYDGMYALAKTLELMARLDVKLSEISSEIPEVNFLHRTVPCPWESKGVVMRKAAEDAMESNATFLDGVKVGSEGSWTLLFPDQYKSLIHIYAEGGSGQEVEELTTEYLAKVEGWVEAQ